MSRIRLQIRILYSPVYALATGAAENISMMLFHVPMQKASDDVLAIPDGLCWRYLVEESCGMPWNIFFVDRKRKVPSHSAIHKETPPSFGKRPQVKFPPQISSTTPPFDDLFSHFSARTPWLSSESTLEPSTAR